jgi:hypothetical protein
MLDMNPSMLKEPWHELRFRPLLEAGRVYAFPCDAKGRVDLDALSERARNDYFYARVLIGRAYRVPVVEIRNGAASTQARFAPTEAGDPAGSRRP